MVPGGVLAVSYFVFIDDINTDILKVEPDPRTPTSRS